MKKSKKVIALLMSFIAGLAYKIGVGVGVQAFTFFGIYEVEVPESLKKLRQ